MSGSVTYEMLSAVFAAVVTVGGAWFFIERRIIGVERDIKTVLENIEREMRIDIKAVTADNVLLREKIYREFVRSEDLLRLEERLMNELREMRRLWEKRFDEKPK